MTDEIETHIAAVHAMYRPTIEQAQHRLSGGEKLLAQFEQAVTAFREHGRAQVCAITERVNELAVAKTLLADETLAGATIAYEPEIVAGGQRFDFAVTLTDQQLYVEVKTVDPRTDDTDKNWEKAVQRRKLLSPDNEYVVTKEWMGATIFGNSFSARSSFLTYTLETEAKLAAHAAVRPGRGILVFCGSGFAWNISELEDFADFYRLGRHRIDDPFAAMEQHAMTDKGIGLTRTLDGFAALVRPRDAVEPSEWIYPVRGPNWG